MSRCITLCRVVSRYIATYGSVTPQRPLTCIEILRYVIYTKDCIIVVIVFLITPSFVFIVVVVSKSFPSEVRTIPERLCSFMPLHVYSDFCSIVIVFLATRS